MQCQNLSLLLGFGDTMRDVSTVKCSPWDVTGKHANLCKVCFCCRPVLQKIFQSRTREEGASRSGPANEHSAKTLNLILGSPGDEC